MKYWLLLGIILILLSISCAPNPFVPGETIVFQPGWEKMTYQVEDLQIKANWRIDLIKWRERHPTAAIYAIVREAGRTAIFQKEWVRIIFYIPKE